MSAGLEADRAFCQRVLPGVSRTFALSIEVLPEELREAVRVSYLICRVVDTIEDTADIPTPLREQLFDSFDQLTEDAGADPGALERQFRQALSRADRREQELCHNAGAVFRTLRALSAEQQQAILPSVQEMSRGMRAYSRRPAEERYLQDLQDLDRYCYFVAGTVGELLTRLFLLQVPLPSAEQTAEMERRAIRFGLGLQLVNVLKDVAGDLQRGECFMPLSEARALGLDLDRLLEPDQRETGLALVRQISAHARGHLRQARLYTLAWPTPAGDDVRLFCAVPLALAQATLSEVEAGHNTLVPGRAPAVTRQTVMQTYAAVRAALGDDAALGALLEA
jgi:farnesyl-diphosphate farnesyltransferase